MYSSLVIKKRESKRIPVGGNSMCEGLDVGKRKELKQD